MHYLNWMSVFCRFRQFFLVSVFWCYGKFVLLLFRLGVRGWWLNEFPGLLVPAALRREAAGAYLAYTKRIGV